MILVIEKIASSSTRIIVPSPNDNVARHLIGLFQISLHVHRLVHGGLLLLPNVPAHVQAKVALQKGAEEMNHVLVEFVVVHEDDIDADILRHGHFGLD